LVIKGVIFTNERVTYAGSLDLIRQKKKSKHELHSLSKEGFNRRKDFQATQYDLADFFEDEFFETKKVVHVPLKFIN
jgi:hypothetical protein